jgi:hypothetical protein
MKGFFAGVAVTAPITALLIYLVMAGRVETVARIERSHVQQQISTEQFDSDFDRAWNSMSLSDKDRQKREKERQERLARLREKEREFDRQFAEQFDLSTADAADFREVLSGEKEEEK